MNTPEDQISGENKTIVFTSKANASIQYALGDIVGDSYILLGLLARGGMGVLFKAKHLQLDRIFALKLLTPSQVSETNWRRFELEGRALAQLNHPNIVQIYNMGVDQKGCPFYVMELLEGQSMAEYIDEQSMPIGQFIQSFKDVCAALQLTHSKGIVHRDIKPSNLFMVQSSTSSSSSTAIKSTKVVDFGIARLTGNEGQNLQGLTRPGEVFGSPAYMSPEQTEGKAVTFASDIYSLGCTMFAALTGHAPFKGTTAIQTMMAHQLDQVPQINRPDFSPRQNKACNEIVARCMEKEPEDRFSNVEQISQLLNRIDSEAARPDLGAKNKQNQNLKNDDTTTTTITSTKSSANRQTKWLIVAAISTMIVTVTIVAAALQLTSTALKQKKATDRLDGLENKSPAVQSREASAELRQERMPVLSEKIDLEEYVKRSNAPLSAVEEIDGTKHRVFNFPTDSSIGYIAPNQAAEKKIKASTKSNNRLDKPALGKIIWPDDQPVNFTGGIKISKCPEIYEHFDDDAIASLTLKGAQLLPSTEVLAQWRNLRWLIFQDCDLDSKYIKGLDALRFLQALSIRHTTFDTDALRELGLLRRLRLLQLTQIKDHSSVLQALANSEQLNCLELGSLNLTESDIQLVANLPQLTRLSLRKSWLQPTAMKELSKCKHLFEINLDGAAYYPNSLFDLGQSSSLRKLQVSSDKYNDAVIERFQKQYPAIKVVKLVAKAH